MIQRFHPLRIKDERTCCTKRIYPAASAPGFETGQNNIFQSLPAKTKHGEIGLPLTWVNLYCGVRRKRTNGLCGIGRHNSQSAGISMNGMKSFHPRKNENIK